MKQKFTNPIVEVVFGGNLSQGHKSAGWPTRVRLYRVNSPVNFLTMFSEVSDDYNKICLTAAQSVKVCKTYPHWFRQNRGNVFILHKIDGRRRPGINNLMVSIMTYKKGALRFHFVPFRSRRIWHAKQLPHLIAWKPR